MSVGVMEARPPYVQFETRALEDRVASEAGGMYMTKDVDFVVVTPQGSKDRIDRVAAEWLEAKAQDVKEQRLPQEWLRAWQEAYKAFKEGKEPPAAGLSVKNWPLLSPAQVANLIAFNIRTVEDLASANEETVNRLGMGGRVLKQKAEEYLKSSGSDASKQAERLTAQSGQIGQLTSLVEQLQEQNKVLSSQVERLLSSQRQPSAGRELAAGLDSSDIGDIIA